MCFLFLIGITGLYARQVEEAGWPGLAGFLLFILSWALQTGFVFTNVFILPPLSTAAPAFVESFLGIVSGHPGEMNLGALAATYNVVGLLYVLGGVLLGIATFRAGILPRWAGALLAFGAVAPLVFAMLPHPLDRMLAVPMGAALLWLGYMLWTERQEHGAEPFSGRGSAHLARSAVD